MEIIIFTSYLILLWYVLNIFWLIIGFNKVKSFEDHKESAATKFTILVPFRNEKENLPQLLGSFDKLNYPTDFFEVILIDDRSEDAYEFQKREYALTLIDNVRKSGSPKKDAINSAIAVAKNDWIITTDADCVVPENWLLTIDTFIQHTNPKMIASGVSYDKGVSLLACFQQVDMLSLQGTTLGSFGNKQAFMCNGANFCYQKSFFIALEGFAGNNNIASGDDVFLLQKAMGKDPEAVRFLKSAKTIVNTKPEASWKSLFYQRVRWASKTANYKSVYSKQVAISVFLMNSIFLFYFITLFLFPISIQILMWFFAMKFLIDFVLLKQSAIFFKKQLHYLLLCSLIYPFFSVLVVVYSFFGKYHWKGRTFKK